MEDQTKWVEIKIHGKNIPRRSYHSSAIYQSKMYIFGGYYINTGTLGDLHCINLSQTAPSFQSIPIKGDSPGDRQSHSCVIYRKKKIIFGGKINSFDSCNCVHSLDFSTLVWKKLQTYKNSPPPIDGHNACIWGQKMVVYGGFFGADIGIFTSSIFTLDLQKLQWQLIFDSLNKEQKVIYPCPRSNAGAVIVKDKLYIFGGTNIQQKFNDLWEYDLISNQWIQVQQQNTPQSRNGHLLISYNNKILMFGGIHDLTHQKNDLLFFNKGKWVVIQMDTSHSKQDKKEVRRLSKSSKPFQAQKNQISNINSSKEPKKLQKYIQLKNSKILKQTLSHMIKQKQKKSKVAIKKLSILAQFQLTPQQKQRYYPPSPTIQSLKSSIAAIGGTSEKKKKSEYYQQKPVYDMAKAGRRIKKKPCARDGHSGVLSGNILYIFGGDRHMMGFNDLYMIDLSQFRQIQ